MKTSHETTGASDVSTGLFTQAEPFDRVVGEAITDADGQLSGHKLVLRLQALDNDDTISVYDIADGRLLIESDCGREKEYYLHDGDGLEYNLGPLITGAWAIDHCSREVSAAILEAIGAN